MFKLTGLAAMAAIALAACSTAASQAAAPEAETATASPNLFLLYTLQEGVTPEDFEDWVRTTDYPSMRGLARVQDFRTYRAERLLPGTGDGAPSVDYIEAFTIPDLDGFLAEDMGGETVQSVMGAFMGFAEAPQFIVVEEVE